MAASDDIEVLSFKTRKSQKRLAKILAAKLNIADVSALMNLLLEREINRNFSESTQQELLSGNVEEEESHQKVSGGRKAKAHASR